jgi:PAS domain S-box-containing protein
MQDAIICADSNGTVIYWNEAAGRLWGWTAEEMMGKSVFERLPAGAAREWGRERFQSVLAGEESSGDRHDYRKDGSRVWIEVRTTRINDASGEPFGILTIGRNITERRQAERELRLFRNLVDQSNVAFEVIDPATGCFLDVNERACLELGYSRKEFLSMRVQDINPLVNDENWPQVVAEVRASGSRTAEYIHRRKDGASFPMEVNSRWVTLDRDYIVAVVRDITERKRIMRELVEAKESAETATRAKSEFLAMISHEIRTPLNPILGAAQLLMDEGSTPEQQELLRVIHNAGEHLLTLLSDLLDLAKMESGAASLVQSACRIVELAQGVFDIKHEEVRGKQLALKLELDPTLAYAYLVDEPRMRQILLNLVGNAVKFTAQGQVMVRVERLDGDGRRDHLRINVSDTGIGIAPEYLQRLFEPFYQVDSSRMRQHEGAGLGLAICRRLVEIMGGEIGVESQVGNGSTFWFKVWLERRRSLDEMGTPWPMPLKSVNHHRVLLAVASDQERLLLIAALEKAGCEVARASSSTDLLTLFTPGNFDLLLIDERVSETGWPQLVKALRERETAEGASAASVVLLSDNINESTRKISQEAGVNSLLARPVRQVELLRMLTTHEPLPSAGAGARIIGSPKGRE